VRRPLVLSVASAAVLAPLLIALTVYSARELGRFQRQEVRRATLYYAAPQLLRAGVHVGFVDLAGALSRLDYRETATRPTAPGQFRRTPDTWDIVLRGTWGGASWESGRVRLEIQDDRISRVSREGHVIDTVRLEPELVRSPGALPGEEYRPVRLAELPPALVNAILAAEDSRFFEHGGLDTRALTRALLRNLRAGKVVEGGSTITQQLVKNRLLSSERTLFRKVNEAWLAALLEWRYSKEQILEAYVNEIYLGHPAGVPVRGVGAAARAHFGKDVHQLALPEAALLAGMIRAPNSYSPLLNPDRARQRRDAVLARMRDAGKISEANYQSGLRSAVRARPGPAPSLVAPYFTDYVRQELEKSVEPSAAGWPAARVLTTLDVPLQRFAERAVARGLERLEARLPRALQADRDDRLQAALVVLDPATGQIRALVGGRDYRTSQFNRAALARRQPGSAFKPFVYLTAVASRGGRPAFTAASPVDDTPITVTTNGRQWSPRNYQDRYEGRVTVRRALEHSLNAATIRIAQTVGLPAVIQTARALGVEGELKPVPAVALGAFEITPIGLARAYLPLASGGLAPPVGAVDSVWDAEGRSLWDADGEARQVVSPAEAFVMTSLLQGVIDSGTGSSARALGLSYPVAGKTGTTNDGRDAWFVGYSSNLLALVWVGLDSGKPYGLSGAEAALPIWTDFMRQALDAYAPRPFPVPPGVTLVDIDVTNGKRANPFCPLVAREAFLAGTEPEPCEEHGGVVRHVLRWWERVREWFRR